jgi:hypothetical protein
VRNICNFILCDNQTTSPAGQISGKEICLAHTDQWPTVAAPSIEVIVMGLSMVMVSELDPAVRMTMVPSLPTALTRWARVLKG